MNYLTVVKPLEDQGLSDAQIAATLGTLYNKDFPINSIEAQEHSILGMLTAEFGVMSMGNLQDWQGPLIDLRASNANVDRAMGMLLGYLQIQGSKLRCSMIPEQGALLQLIGTAVAGIVQTQHDAAPTVQTKTGADVLARIDQVTGGLKYPGIDAAAVAASRTVYQASVAETTRQNAIEALRARIENDFINPATTEGSGIDVATLTADIKANL